jgi:hypothetical protein
MIAQAAQTALAKNTAARMLDVLASLTKAMSPVLVAPQ